jgi:hypothetical protein
VATLISLLTAFFRLGSRGLVVLLGLVLCGCVTPPKKQNDICAVFDQRTNWYDYAKASEERWGTPSHILMAFIKQESAYTENAKPPRDWFLFIPLGRKSSAKGYAQIQNPAWKDYTKENGRLFKSRTDMKDALDFIGWYNDHSSKRLGISKWNPKQLYLAYHEGHGGYRQGSYRDKPGLIRAANRVDTMAREYGAQLSRCESRFKCHRWYQFWPFCRK